MDEKQLARQAGLSRSMVRYYLQHGFAAGAEDEAAAAALLRTVDTLRDAGFPEGDILAMQQGTADVRLCAGALCQKIAETEPGLARVLRRIAGGADAQTCETLAAALRTADRTVRRHTLNPASDTEAASRAAFEKRQQSLPRRGRVLFFLLAGLLLLDSVLAILTRGTWLPLVGHTVLTVLLLFGIDWIRYLRASFNAGELLILVLTAERAASQPGGSYYLPTLVVSALILIVTAVVTLLSRSVAAYLFVRRNG